MAARSMRDAVPSRVKKQVKRKGVHAKRGTSSAKTSKNYQKAYRGQGRGR